MIRFVGCAVLGDRFSQYKIRIWGGRVNGDEVGG